MVRNVPASCSHLAPSSNFVRRKRLLLYCLWQITSLLLLRPEPRRAAASPPAIYSPAVFITDCKAASKCNLRTDSTQPGTTSASGRYRTLFQGGSGSRAYTAITPNSLQLCSYYIHFGISEGEFGTHCIAWHPLHGCNGTHCILPPLYPPLTLAHKLSRPQ